VGKGFLYQCESAVLSSHSTRMRGKIKKNNVQLAGDSIEIQTGYFTNTNLEYRVYVILIPVLNETTEESRTDTKWLKLFEAERERERESVCVCVCVCARAQCSHLWELQRETYENNNYISNNITTTHVQNLSENNLCQINTSPH
jgi:hypothetical protein